MTAYRALLSARLTRLLACEAALRHYPIEGWISVGDERTPWTVAAWRQCVESACEAVTRELVALDVEAGT